MPADSLLAELVSPGRLEATPAQTRAPDVNPPQSANAAAMSRGQQQVLSFVERALPVLSVLVMIIMSAGVG